MNCLATTLTFSFSVPQSIKPRNGTSVESTYLIFAGLLTTRDRLLLECLDSSFDLVSKVPGLGHLVIQQRKILTSSVYSV